MPTYYLDPSSDSKMQWTAFGTPATATGFDHVNKAVRQPSVPSTASGIQTKTVGNIFRPFHATGVPTFASNEICLKATLWIYADTPSGGGITNVVYRDNDASVPRPQGLPSLGASQAAGWYSFPVDTFITQASLTGGPQADYVGVTSTNFTNIYAEYVQLDTVYYDGHFFSDPGSDYILDAGWAPFGTPATATGFDHVNKAVRQPTAPSTASGIQSNAAPTPQWVGGTGYAGALGDELYLAHVVWVYGKVGDGSGKLGIEPTTFTAVSWGTTGVDRADLPDTTAAWRRASHVQANGAMNPALISGSQVKITEQSAPGAGQNQVYAAYSEFFTVRKPRGLVTVEGIANSRAANF